MTKDIKIKGVAKTVEYISNIPKFINQSPTEMLNLESNF
jgi:hypothetical protein